MTDTEKDAELKLLDYARRSAVHAELLATCAGWLDRVSPDTARIARKDAVEAIERLQAFERLLTRRIDGTDQ